MYENTMFKSNTRDFGDSSDYYYRAITNIKLVYPKSGGYDLPPVIGHLGGRELKVKPT
jgi:hypothetical protein